MKPLTVIVHLRTPPVVREPVLLDGVLFGGLGAASGGARDDGWAVLDGSEPLPLARVERGGLWWYAASQATPWGPERAHHAHRRLPSEWYERYTSERVTSFAAGPDKSLRVRLHYRPAMLSVRWTCIGDADEVRHLLSFVGGIGHRVTHGFGQVERWKVVEGGPELSAYAADVRVRHLPVQLSEAPPDAWCAVAPRRLTPPYWKPDGAVQCRYVPAEFGD